MLCELKIENVAVIEKATANFTKGLNVLTGETGAGKSILIDSINAILGNRTSKELVRTGAAKAAIWATFNNISPCVKAQLENAGYEALDEIMLYREITAEGKSTCRINGMPATASIVRDICDGLINIHGQHDNQSLTNPAKHLGVLDSFAQNQRQHEEYYKVYHELCLVKREIKALNTDEAEKQRQMDFLSFKIEELESANLVEGEEETLTLQKNKISHAKNILTALQMAYGVLSGDDDTQGAVELLGTAYNSMQSAALLSEDYAEIAEHLNDFYYGAKETASEINDILQSADFDPRALDDIEERLDLLYRLRQKYGANVTEMLLALDEAKAELEKITFSEQRLEKLYVKQKELYTKARALADILTKTRLDAFERFKKQIIDALDFLNMPGIRFTLIHSVGVLASTGQDSVEFYLSANPGEEPKPLGKIASGGELSRIMLAIKSALADKDEIDTLIYDEIDTGVSGLAAGRIGEKLRQAAQGRQIICITHTAQIASFADTQLLIKKSVDKDRTFTQIVPLDDEARINELARIISGDKVTELALANAKEMLFLHRA
ncbi:MAG: DNA repair protein RecN [Oscillospiraceae bacterium]